MGIEVKTRKYIVEERVSLEGKPVRYGPLLTGALGLGEILIGASYHVSKGDVLAAARSAAFGVLNLSLAGLAYAGDGIDTDWAHGYKVRNFMCAAGNLVSSLSGLSVNYPLWPATAGLAVLNFLEGVFRPNILQKKILEKRLYDI
jgi:hypothetical protein